MASFLSLVSTLPLNQVDVIFRTVVLREIPFDETRQKWLLQSDSELSCSVPSGSGEGTVTGFGEMFGIMTMCAPVSASEHISYFG